VSLQPESGLFRSFRNKDVHAYGKALAHPGDGAVVVLPVAAQIDAQHLAVFTTAYEASYPIGKVVPVYPAGARTPPLREDQQVLPAMQKINAFFQNELHFFPVSAAVDGDTFHQVAHNGRKDVPLKIDALRQIPGKQLESRHVAVHGGNGIG